MDSNSYNAKIQAVRRNIRQLDKKTCRTTDEFNKTLTQIVRLKTEEQALLIVKKCVVDALSAFIQRTPVDTGRARAGWMFSDSRVPTEAPDKDMFQKTGTGQSANTSAINKALSDALQGVSNASLDAVWHIVNNVEYIQMLEAGWSRQAPQGFVAITLHEMNKQLQSLLRTV